MAASVTILKINNKTGSIVRVFDGQPSVSWTFVGSPIVDPSTGSVTNGDQGSFELRIGSSAVNLGASSFVGDVAATGFVSGDQSLWRYTGWSLARGHTYYVQVRAKDTFGNTSGWKTTQLRFNALPTVAGVTVTPSSPKASDTLAVSYSYADADGDAERGTTIRWFRNGVYERNLADSLSVPPAYLTVGDTWTAEVTPNDGYERGVMLGVTSVTVVSDPDAAVPSGPRILPASPTYFDPLYADFLYDGSEPAVVRWYVNGSHASPADDRRFYRFDLAVGDEVYFTATANATTATSATATIAEPGFKVFNVRIDGASEPLALLTTRPTLSWDLIQPAGKRAAFAGVKIGTTAGASDVYSKVLQITENRVGVPPHLLVPGHDYHVSVAAGDTATTLGDYERSHFRLAGSLWQSSVSNSTGWTVECVVSVTSGYQGFRIADGTKFVEVRFTAGDSDTPDSVSVISQTTTTANSVFAATPTTFTVVGSGSDVRVYQNHRLLVDATGAMSQPAIDTYLEFGATGTNTSNSTGTSAADWYAVRYTVAGAFAPEANPLFNSFQFRTVLELPQSEITAVTRLSGNLVIAAEAEDDTANLYSYYPEQANLLAGCVSRCYSPVNRIVQSPGKKFTYFCHANGATFFRGYPVVAYDQSLDLTSQTPEANGWQAVMTSGFVSTPTAGGIVIDTMNGGKWFYTQRSHGTPWFDRVDNTRGYSFDFTMKVDAVGDDGKADKTPLPEGVGVYVNDGEYFESVHFFENQIVFAYSGVKIACDTTVNSDYRLTGVGNTLELWGKSTAATKYSKLGRAGLTFRGSQEGNGGRPQTVVDGGGITHCVWHDDGRAGGRQVLYSWYEDGEWSVPSVIVGNNFNAANPHVTTDGERLFVAFESHMPHYTNVGLVVKNELGWGEPGVIVDAGVNTVRPSLAVSGDGVLHAVWEDYRHELPSVYYSHNGDSGEWSTEVRLSTGTSAAVNPAIDGSGDTIAAGWTVLAASGSTIAGRVGVVGTGAWTAPFTASTTATAADYCDVMVYHDTCLFFWHDRQSGNYQIYYNRFSQSGVGTGQVTVTDNDFSCTHPSVGVDKNSKDVVVAFEGDDGVSNGVYASIVSLATNTWYSSGQASNDVLIDPLDGRRMRRPNVAKRFADSVQLAYEAELVESFDEYEVLADEFVTIMSTTYDRSQVPDYELPNFFPPIDFRVSGQLPRKEIRFGDFSDSYKGRYVYSKAGMYLGAAVEPFEIGLVSTDTQSIPDDRSFAALVNDNGDAWLGTQGGLAFYFKDANKVSVLDEAVIVRKPVHALAVSGDGSLFVAAGTAVSNVNLDSIYVSTNHYDFIIVTGAPTGVSVNEMAFGDAGVLWVATATGLYALSTSLAAATAAASFTVTTLATFAASATGLPSSNVLSLATEAGRVWVGTDAGLALVVNNVVVQVWTTTNSGLLSNRINDIAVRDANVRYVATPAGVCEMRFDRFSRFVSSDDTHWNNNVRAVAWADPNVLFVTTQSDIVQVQLDEASGNHKTLVFGIANYALNATAYNDLRTYYATGFDVTQLNASASVEVYVNGRRVPAGYTVSSDLKIVQFETPLKVSDFVQVKYRNDLRLYSTFRQNATEVAAVGHEDRRVNRLLVVDDLVYAHTLIDGEPALYRFDTATSPTLPYTQIVLDTTPPTAVLKIDRQVGRNKLLVDIEYAADNLSGVSKMIVSNYSNFTTDGSTAQAPIDFAEQVIQTIPTTFESGVTSKAFTTGEGSGNALVRFDNGTTDTVYVGTKGPAKVFQYGPTTDTWSAVKTLDPASQASVDFMIVYKDTLYVGVGKDAGSTVIYQSTDGTTYTAFKTIAAAHVYASVVFRSSLYLGGSDGRIYKYDGVSFGPGYEVYTGSGPVLSLAGYLNQLYVTKGDTGNVIQVNVDTKTQTVIFTSPDPNVSAARTFTHGNKTYLYIGTRATGKVYVRDITTTGGVFTPSFAGLAVPVSVIRTGDGTALNTVIKAAVGNQLYQQTVGTNDVLSGWANVSTFADTVLDFTTTDGAVSGTFNTWAVTPSAIYLIPPQSGNFTIYLKLFDAAGNATVGNTIFDQISIDNLSGYVNENRILTLDPSGNQINAYEGSAPFYSAKLVEQESGEYYSDVFFGTNNLISWDLLMWTAGTPVGTEVSIYLRSADTRDGVLSAAWSSPYGSNFQTGVDISFVQGKYIQFRASLTTTVPGVTPTLSNVIIRSKASEATHFYTTNFVLGSKVRRGLLTAQTVVPVSADIIFGVDTNNSTDFADYQTVEPDKVFVLDSRQAGTGLRVGIKFISPTPGVFGTDVFAETGPYDEPLLINAVDFDFSTAGVYNFVVSLFEDVGRTRLAYSQSSATNPSGFTADSVPMTEAGVTVGVGQTVKVAFVPPADAALVCNTYYYVEVAKDDGLTSAVFSDDHVFITSCNTTFVDDVLFSFKNTGGTTKTYQFRVRFYSDPELTDEVLVYYSGSNADNWTADAATFPTAGKAIAAGGTVAVDLNPPSSDMELGKVYHLAIDAFDGSTFVPVSTNLTFRVSDPVADAYCGEYQNVPIVQNFGVVFQLEDGRLVKLNR